MMAHRIKVVPNKSFRFNLSVCPPYNADFDGDEMNLHALQTEEAKTEAICLMDVKHNIISPRFGGPVVGLDLDQISGLYLLTKKGTIISREEAAQLFADAGIDIKLPLKDKFTGKELFSLLLPKELDMEFKANCCRNCDECIKENCEYDAWVKIRNGELITGTIDAKAAGAFKGKIINKLEKMFDDKEIVKKFIDDAGRLGTAFIMKRGFSIALSDLDLPENIRKKIKTEIDKAQEEANTLIEKYKKQQLSILPGLTAEDSLEAQVMNALASGVSRVSDIVAENVKQTDVMVMALSGAKGSIINTTQIAAVVGQETILGKRIKRGYLYRTLPHIKPFDLSPVSRGFVARGFKDGLTPFELFWNIMNGREGLMDKSLRTRKSGYMQRRLMNALQDLKVVRDTSIRNSNDQIIQFYAGEDGMDPSKSYWGGLNWKEYVKEAE